jgi:two-component system NtrC family sensor kinase
MDIEYEDLDLNDVLREVISFLEKEALYRNIKIELNLDENLSRISSDRGQLQQVFLNILSNALAAVDDNGNINIRSREVDEDTVEASIKDDGCGMSEKDLKNIFEPFFTTKKGYGTGLGLPITYGIIKKMNGTIKVESQLGKGSTFSIYLPKIPKKVLGV